VKIKIVLAALLVMGTLASCAMKPHPMDMATAVQNAKTSADHEALARHYEDAAKEMQTKIDEHKTLLAQYESKSYLFGKQGQNLTAHCKMLIDFYEKAAKENLEMAAMHHQLASGTQ
jgi:hypothetical protein